MLDMIVQLCASFGDITAVLRDSPDVDYFTDLHVIPSRANMEPNLITLASTKTITWLTPHNWSSD